MLALWLLCSAEAQGRLPENGREADGGSGAKQSGRRPLHGHSEGAWSGPELEHNIHSATIHASSANRSRSQINEISSTHFFSWIRGRLACAFRVMQCALDEMPTKSIERQ